MCLEGVVVERKPLVDKMSSGKSFEKRKSEQGSVRGCHTLAGIDGEWCSMGEN